MMRQNKSLLLLTFPAGISNSSIPIAIITVPIILPVLTLRTWISLLDPKTFIFALPIILPILAFRTRIALLDPKVFIQALPITLPILTYLAGIALGDIPIAIEAPPVSLPVLALAGVALGVIEVTVVATPGVLPIAALAGVSLLRVPPVGRVHACSAPLHAVSSGVADMASRAGPVVLPVLAFIAGVALLGILLAVLAVPRHQQDMFTVQNQQQQNGFQQLAQKKMSVVILNCLRKHSRRKRRCQTDIQTDRGVQDRHSQMMLV